MAEGCRRWRMRSLVVGHEERCGMCRVGRQARVLARLSEQAWVKKPAVFWGKVERDVERGEHREGGEGRGGARLWGGGTVYVVKSKRNESSTICTREGRSSVGKWMEKKRVVVSGGEGHRKTKWKTEGRGYLSFCPLSRTPAT